MRAGLAGYCPEAVLALWNSFELESAVCGEPDIPLDKFKESARFHGPPPAPVPPTTPVGRRVDTRHWGGGWGA